MVNVSTESTPKVRRRGGRAPNRGQRDNGGDDPFQDFFDRFFGGQQGGQGGQGGPAAMTMIKARRVRLAVPEAAVDASVRSVQA